MEKGLVSFESNYLEEIEIGDVVCKVYIDGYSNDENAEGSVVAVVSITRSGDIVVDWHNNGYRNNSMAIEAVSSAIIKAIEYYKTSPRQKKIYLVNANYDFKMHDEDEIESLTDFEFIDIAEAQGLVFTINEFPEYWNNSNIGININECYMRIL